VDVERDGKPHLVRFADLPGYGFAKVSKSERAEWQTMITTYLEKRRDLKVVVSIIDAEVGPTPDDFQTLDYLQNYRRILVVATKTDRLAKATRKPRLAALTEQFSLPREAVLPFSAVENLGQDEV